MRRAGLKRLLRQVPPTTASACPYYSNDIALDKMASILHHSPSTKLLGQQPRKMDEVLLLGALLTDRGPGARAGGAPFHRIASLRKGCHLCSSSLVVPTRNFCSPT